MLQRDTDAQRMKKKNQAIPAEDDLGKSVLNDTKL